MTDHGKIYVWIVTSFLFVTVAVKAQVDAQYSQYNEILNYYNPAAAGRDNQLAIQAIHKMQWVGMDNAPMSFFFTAHSPIRFLRQNHGIGFALFNESIGLYTNQSFALQYAYKMNLWGGQLSFGPQLGLFDQRFDATKIHIPSSDYHQPSEEGIPTGDMQGMTFDMAFGIFYSHKNFYVGLSCMHLLESTVELDSKMTSYLPRAYYFSAGYNIPLKKSLIELQPSLLLKTDLNVVLVDVSLRAWYDKRFYAAMTWRYGDAVVVMAGARIKSVQVGYAYDINTSAIAKVSSGSHEMMLSYCFDWGKLGHKKNKHKSVRIL